MPDPYATIATADTALQSRLAGVLKLRASEAQQREMLDSYLSEIRLPDAASALEVGCGTGAVTRVRWRLPDDDSSHRRVRSAPISG